MAALVEKVSSPEATPEPKWVPGCCEPVCETLGKMCCGTGVLPTCFAFVVCSSSLPVLLLSYYLLWELPTVVLYLDDPIAVTGIAVLCALSNTIFWQALQLKILPAFRWWRALRTHVSMYGRARKDGTTPRTFRDSLACFFTSYLQLAAVLAATALLLTRGQERQDGRQLIGGAAFFAGSVVHLAIAKKSWSGSIPELLPLVLGTGLASAGYISPRIASGAVDCLVTQCWLLLPVIFLAAAKDLLIGINHHWCQVFILTVCEMVVDTLRSIALFRAFKPTLDYTDESALMLDPVFSYSLVALLAVEAAVHVAHYVYSGYHVFVAGRAGDRRKLAYLARRSTLHMSILGGKFGQNFILNPKMEEVVARRASSLNWKLQNKSAYDAAPDFRERGVSQLQFQAKNKLAYDFDPNDQKRD